MVYLNHQKRYSKLKKEEMEMTVKDLLYACGNVDNKMLITVVQATGKELVSQKKVSLFYELPESESILL